MRCGEICKLASTLRIYRDLNDLDETALAAYLGCNIEALPRLALCRRPESDRPGFRQQVEQIAIYAGTRLDRLAQVIREVDAMKALSNAPFSDERASRRGFLMAARDSAEEGHRPEESINDADREEGPEERGSC